MDIKNSAFHDILIVGGGPRGTTLAVLLAKKGIDVGLIEEKTFPRFKTGESLPPISLDILNESKALDRVESSGVFLKKMEGGQRSSGGGHARIPKKKSHDSCQSDL